MSIVNVNDQKLNELGIIKWQPRVATCMVLLSAKQHATETLAGMLKVLDLPAAHLIRVIVKNFDQNQLAAKLQIWQPRYILQLSMEYPQVRDSKIIRTFSPDHLATHPKDKASAYQQLLALRDLIHHDPI